MFSSAEHYLFLFTFPQRNRRREICRSPRQPVGLVPSKPECEQIQIPNNVKTILSGEMKIDVGGFFWNNLKSVQVFFFFFIPLPSPPAFMEENSESLNNKSRNRGGRGKNTKQLLRAVWGREVSRGAL